MINVVCIDCGEDFDVPDSLAGHTEICPRCHNVCLIRRPPPPSKPAVPAVTMDLGRPGTWSTRQRILGLGIAIAILITIGAIASVSDTRSTRPTPVVPTWQPAATVTRTPTPPPRRAPAPVLRAPAEFPPLAQLEVLLGRFRIYTLCQRPEIGTLCGRRLIQRGYVLDLSDLTTTVSLWSAPEAPDSIIAMSTMLVYPLQPDGHIDRTNPTKTLQLFAFTSIVEDLCGLSFTDLIDAPAADGGIGSQPVRTHTVVTPDGWTYHGRYGPLPHLGTAVMYYVLGDSRWRP